MDLPEDLGSSALEASSSRSAIWAGFSLLIRPNGPRSSALLVCPISGSNAFQSRKRPGPPASCVLDAPTCRALSSRSEQAARVHADHHRSPLRALQLDVGRPDQARGLHVNQPVTEHVSLQQHLAGTPLEAPQVQPGAGQPRARPRRSCRPARWARRPRARPPRRPGRSPPDSRHRAAARSRRTGGRWILRRGPRASARAVRTGAACHAAFRAPVLRTGVSSSELRRGDPGLQAGEETPLPPSACRAYPKRSESEKLGCCADGVQVPGVPGTGAGQRA